MVKVSDTRESKSADILEGSVGNENSVGVSMDLGDDMCANVASASLREALLLSISHISGVRVLIVSDESVSDGDCGRDISDPTLESNSSIDGELIFCKSGEYSSGVTGVSDSCGVGAGVSISKVESLLTSKRLDTGVKSLTGVIVQSSVIVVNSGEDRLVASSVSIGDTLRA